MSPARARPEGIEMPDGSVWVPVSLLECPGCAYDPRFGPTVFDPKPDGRGRVFRFCPYCRRRLVRTPGGP